MVATNDTAELALVGSKLGQTVIVTHHFRMTEVGTGRTLQDLIDKWQAAAQTQWLAALRGDYTLDKIRARHVCGSLPLDATTEEAVGSAGTAAVGGDQVAPWISALVRARTALAGRERRGRFFIPLSDEADFSKDDLQSSAITRLQAYVTALQGAFLPGGTQVGFWQMAVHSRKLASIPGTQCQNSSTVVTSLALQTKLTTQRSRRQRPV